MYEHYLRRFYDFASELYPRKALRPSQDVLWMRRSIVGVDRNFGVYRKIVVSLRYLVNWAPDW